MRNFHLGLVAFAAALAMPLSALAESNITTGAGSPLTATARLDFKIVVPKIIYVRIGTGANLAANGTIDLLTFTVPAANVGDGTVISGVGGDIGGGVVTARVIGNNGAITFGSTTTGPLSDGVGDTISFAQMAVAVAANTSVLPLASPALVDGATTNIALTPNIGTKVTNLDAKWTFTYLNGNIVPQGTYGGVNTNGGRVTYTASMP